MSSSSSSLVRVYQFRVFDTRRRLWVELTREPCSAPCWRVEARQQNGLVVASRTAPAAKVEQAWRRYSSQAEVIWLS